MIIKELDREAYKGQEYRAEIVSDRYLSVEPDEKGFAVRWVMSGEPLRMSIRDVMLEDWLENPTAYGAFEGDRLVGFAEGFLEKWNNRYRITNICVFDSAERRKGTGTRLMAAMLEEAIRSGARMAVLETQNFNFKAISFYQKNGFEIIGFDRYAYSNRDPEEHNVRIEMGRKLCPDRDSGRSAKKATRASLARIAREKALIPFHGEVDGMASNLAPIVRPFPTWSLREAEGLWCAAFVYYCCAEAGFGLPYRPDECRTCHLAGCIAWEEWALGDPRIGYHKGSEAFVPEAGDLVIYDGVCGNGEHDHMGIVLERRAHTILAAEGNVHNVSGLVERPVDRHIRAYIRIPDGYRYEAR